MMLRVESFPIHCNKEIIPPRSTKKQAGKRGKFPFAGLYAVLTIGGKQGGAVWESEKGQDIVPSLERWQSSSR